VRLSELSECTLVMPKAYENIPGCSHHLWGKVEKLTILASEAGSGTTTMEC